MTTDHRDIEEALVDLDRIQETYDDDALWRLYWFVRDNAGPLPKDKDHPLWFLCITLQEWMGLRIFTIIQGNHSMGPANSCKKAFIRSLETPNIPMPADKFLHLIEGFYL